MYRLIVFPEESKLNGLCYDGYRKKYHIYMQEHGINIHDIRGNGGMELCWSMMLQETTGCKWKKA